MMPSITIAGVDGFVVKWVGITLFMMGVFGITLLLALDPEAFPNIYRRRYVRFLERKLRKMFIWISGDTIAAVQLVIICALVACQIAFNQPIGYLAMFVVAYAPAGVIERMRANRVLQIEDQVHTFLTTLSNALKTTPSLGDAIISITQLIPYPLRQELELANKEMRLGSSVDQALLLMGNRVGSRQLDTALCAILVGRQVGGNLPKVLDTTGNSLREMARLEGVVRTKTAEGRMQAWTLAFFPFLFAFAFNWAQPGYFDSLTESTTGFICLGIAMMLWVTSIVVANKVLAVDI